MYDNLFHCTHHNNLLECTFVGKQFCSHCSRAVILTSFAVQGLECNGKHWPCLDGVITVLYVLNNYEGESESSPGKVQQTVESAGKPCNNTPFSSLEMLLFVV